MATISGGDKLNKVLLELATRVSNPGTLRVGFLEGATYPDTKPTKLRAQYAKRKAKGVEGAIKGSAGGTSVAMIAAIQEFGAPSRGIPPRPFFRNMIAAKSPEWPDAIGKLLVANKYDATKTLKMAGEAIAGQLRESITTFVGPGLKPATIKRKGFSKELIDSGHLLASVDYSVD